VFVNNWPMIHCIIALRVDSRAGTPYG
jgi:hypothetical protein